MNESFRQHFFTVTRLSKLLAMLLFVLLPFVGVYIGYTFAPKKVVEVEREVEVVKIVEVEKEVRVSESDQFRYFQGAFNEEGKKISSNAILVTDSGFKIITRPLYGAEATIVDVDLPGFQHAHDYVLENNYLFNNDFVIYTGSPLALPKRVEGVNAGSFTTLGGLFMTDGESVVFQGDVLEGVDATLAELKTYTFDDGVEYDRPYLEAGAITWAPDVSGCVKVYTKINTSEIDSHFAETRYKC